MHGNINVHTSNGYSQWAGSIIYSLFGQLVQCHAAMLRTTTVISLYLSAFYCRTVLVKM